MKIGFVSSDWSLNSKDANGYPFMGGAGWYRCKIVAEELKKHGHEVYVCPLVGFDNANKILLPTEWNQIPVYDCDIIVLQRWMHSKAVELIRQAKKSGQIIINDVDDYFEGIHPSNKAFVTTHPRLGKMNREQARATKTPIQNVDNNRNMYSKIVGASSIVTVSTPFLADKYKKFGIPIVVLRNAIDLERWKPQPLSTRVRSIGWVGATTHRSDDLQILRGSLNSFLSDNEIVFVHSGALPTSISAREAMRLDPKIPVLENSTQTIDLYPSLFEGIDIGLAPLSNIPFNRAKSAIKGMEYAASGVPFVASKLDEYKWFGQGLLADSQADWIKSLKKLLDHDVRQEIVEKALERVQKEDIHIRWQDWETVYKNLLAGQLVTA